MRKQLLLLIPALLLVGCGGENVTTSDVNSNGTTNETTLTQPVVEEYVVNVKYPTGKAVTGDVSVEWWNEDGLIKSVLVDDKGTASSSDLTDGVYNIRLSNIPEGYAYDPNGYEVNESKKKITIFLSSIIEYEEGDGTKYEQGKDKGPYFIKSNGAYNVSLTNENPIKYYAFKPSNPGKFIIESWTTDCDPILYIYGSNFAFIPDFVDDDSIFDNVSKLNKNFKYDLDISSKTYGPEGSDYAIVFGVSVNDENKEVSFPINIKCLEVYDFYDPNSTSKVVDAVAENVPEVYARPSNASIAVPKINGSDIPVYNETDGLYHLNTQDGPVLLANIDHKNDLFYESFVDMQSGEASDRAFTFDGVNYNNFITQYKAAINIDGLVPVNQELKNFLDLFMKNDRAGILAFEGLTYSSYSWLACCSYYLIVE